MNIKITAISGKE